jgi:hypothetical protein
MARILDIDCPVRYFTHLRVKITVDFTLLADLHVSFYFYVTE